MFLYNRRLCTNWDGGVSNCIPDRRCRVGGRPAGASVVLIFFLVTAKSKIRPDRRESISEGFDSSAVSMLLHASTDSGRRT